MKFPVSSCPAEAVREAGLKEDMMRHIVLYLLLLCSPLIAQVEYSDDTKPLQQIFNFYIETGNFKSAVPNKTRVDVFVQVPYTSIQFVKKPDGYFANYNVTVTFLDENKKNILFERIWKEKVKTQEFDPTISRDNFNLSYKTYDLNPGTYFMKCIVEDSDSKVSGLRESPLKVRAINDTLDISDIVLVSDMIKDSTNRKIIPNVANQVTNRTRSLSFYFELYSGRNQDVYLEYSLNDFKKNITFNQADPHRLKPGVNLIQHTINNTAFSMGDYSLTAVLKDENWKEKGFTERKFSSKIYGIPNSITDLDKTIDQLLYIASPAEIEIIKQGADYTEKMSRFLAFWNKKKPNPKEDENPILFEYYRRVEYANHNFKGFGEGWRSDRGMVYITFGPPSYVERHPMDSDSKPYEIWEYYEINRSFVFLDQTGFGDYRIVNPDYSHWPGYRQ